MTLSARTLRTLLRGYIGLVAAVTLLFALLHARSAHPWIIGEWLINYSGGFMRRGLPGAVLMLAHRVSHLPLVGLASLLQVALYLAFYVSLLPLLRGLRWSVALLALLLSPATLAFTVLDPPTSVRKEILLFLPLALMANAVVRGRARPRWLCGALCAVAPLAILSHEALAVFLPYLAVPVMASVARPREALRLLLLPTLLAGIALGAVITHPGGPVQAAAICSSVGGHLEGTPGDLCHGAIHYLIYTPGWARAETARAIAFYSYGTRYPLPMLLAALPLAWLLAERLRRRCRLAGAMLLVTGVSILASIPLFMIARDWGRWTEIHSTCLLLLLLMLERDAPPQGRSSEPPREAVAGLKLAPATLLALAIYATCWTLPAVGIFPGRFGYVDLVRYLRGYHNRPHLSDETSSSP